MNWYQRAKLVSQNESWDWGRFNKNLVPALGIPTMIAIIALVLGVPKQQAEQIVQSNPEQAKEIVKQAPPEIIQQAVNEPEQAITLGLVSIEEISAQIAEHEGYSKNVYLDTTGNPTVAYGFNLNRPDANKILADLGLDWNEVRHGRQSVTPEQGNKLLELMTMEAISIAFNFIPDLDIHPQEVQKVVIDMAYNMGGPTLYQFKKMQTAIMKKDYQTAANEMIDSKWYNQVGNRSKYLVKMMERASDH